MADLVNNGKRLPLTEDYLTPKGIQPLYIGDDVHFRFRVLGLDLEPVDISGYSVQAVITLGTTVVTRSSGVPIVGAGVDQITIETQAGATIGYYRLNFSHVGSDVALLSTIIGRAKYTVALTDVLGKVATHVAGPIDIIQP
jgi:hypothetical protein